MPLNTRQKIACARAASRVVQSARRLVGLGPELQARRDGIQWNLDLREGFEFSIFAFGGIELETMRAYRRLVQNGDVVLDLGANIGAHALPLAVLVGDRGRVYSFEASDHAFRRQLDNIALNPNLAGRITATQALLVSDADATKPEGIPSSWPLEQDAETAVHPVHLGKYHSVSQARALRLDDWMEETKPERLNFVKLDVDGYEIDVLRGARELFAHYRPLLLMEFMPYIFPERGQSFAELLEVLVAMGYRAEDLAGCAIVLDRSVEQRIPAGGSINVLLRPTDRMADGGAA
jgi:FkbM family methyltransferase